MIFNILNEKLSNRLRMRKKQIQQWGTNSRRPPGASKTSGTTYELCMEMASSWFHI